MKGSGSLVANCFVCDEMVVGPHECLLQSYTQYSKVPVPTKLSTLVGDDFIVIVNANDVLCNSCTRLVNHMDKLDEDLFSVRSLLSTYLAKKYNINESQIGGHSSRIGNKEIVECDELNNSSLKEEILECDICDFYTCNVSTFNSHICEHESSVGEEISTSLLENGAPVDISINKKSYKCGFCDKQFNTRKLCKHHIWISHSTEYSMQNNSNLYTTCLKCNKVTDNSDGLSRIDAENSHFQNVSCNKYSEYMCSICGKYASSTEDINKYFGVNIQSENISVCHICGEQKKTEIELQSHLESHEGDSHLSVEEKKDSNKLCQVENSTEFFKASIESINVVSSSVCQIDLSEYSSNTFLDSTSLNQTIHEEIIINPDSSKDYVCQLCGVETLNEDSLKKHLRQHEEINYDSIEIFVCPLCNNVCNSRNDLEEHIRGHNFDITEIELKNCDSKLEYTISSNIDTVFKCKICNKEFPSDLKLKEHVVVHEAKIGNLQCEYCLETFDKRHDFITHIKNKHSDIRVTLLCPLCSRKSATRYALKRHVVKCHLVSRLQKAVRDKYAEGLDLINKVSASINMKHEINVEEKIKALKPANPILQENEEKEYTCGFSHFKCKNVESANDQSKTHGLKKLTCTLCIETFNSVPNLVIHLESEHKITLSNTQCPHCLEDLGDSLEDHLKEKHNEIYETLTCFECGSIFDNKSSLEDHTKKLHLNIRNNENIMIELASDSSMLEELGILDADDNIDSVKEEAGPFNVVMTNEIEKINFEEKCDICPATGTKSEMEEHMKMHGPTCDICKKEFRSNIGWEKHLKTHSEEFLSVACLLCPLKLHDKTHLRCHMKQAHQGNEQPYCLPCNKYFSQKASYLKHKCARHTSDKVCQICGKQFTVMRKFLFHKEYFHREELSCTYCKKQFRDVKKLKLHEYIHKRNEGKTYDCDNCNKTFKTSSGLRFHKLSHTGNYPFFCEYCGRGFVSTHHLEEHVAKHTGEERFVCDVCGKRFQLYDTYHRHRNLHDNPYPKQCDICKQFFRNASRVAEHKRKVHTGERPYKCPFCPMTFNISSTYKVHLCIHTQKFPYNCTVCERGFTTRIKYATHLATKHGDFSVLNDKKPNYRQVFPENYV